MPARGHLRVHPTRAQGVDGHAPGHQLQRQGSGKTDEPVLAGAVGCISGNPELPQYRGHVDDAAVALIAHDAEHFLRYPIDAREIRIDDGVPQTFVRVIHRGHPRGAGIVDQDVNLPPLLMDPGHATTDAGRVSHVDGDRQHRMALFAEFFGHGLEPRRVARSDDDPGALLCHGARHGFADAGAAARDQRYPSRKIHSLFTFSPPEEREAVTGPIPRQGPTR